MIKPKPLFQKIDASVADQFRAKYGGSKQKKQTAGEEAANTSDGNAADMDVATLQAEITKQVRSTMCQPTWNSRVENCVLFWYPSSMMRD